jgi:uridine kinase
LKRGHHRASALIDFILWQYKNTVLPAQWQYVLPSKRYADLILQSDAELPAVEKSVYDAIVDSHVLAATQQPEIIPADLC